MTAPPLRLHPLNRAAARRLKEMGADLRESDPALCALAVLAAAEVYGEDGQETLRAESLRQRSPKSLFRTLATELEWTPESVTSLPLATLGEDVGHLLQPEPPRD